MLSIYYLAIHNFSVQEVLFQGYFKILSLVCIYDCFIDWTKFYSSYFLFCSYLRSQIFFCLILFVVIINMTRLSSNLSPNHSNFRSRIICGPFLGSFVVLYRPLKTITNRATYTFLARVQSPESRVQSPVLVLDYASVSSSHSL